MANGITFVVDEVKAYLSNLYSESAPANYVFLLVKFRVTNNTENSVLSYLNLNVMDDFANQYASWSNVGFDQFPNFSGLLPSQSLAAVSVYNVPIVALNYKLRIRLDDPISKTLIEIYLGDITIEPIVGTPIATP